MIKSRRHPFHLNIVNHQRPKYSLQWSRWKLQILVSKGAGNPIIIYQVVVNIKKAVFKSLIHHKKKNAIANLRKHIRVKMLLNLESQEKIL